MSGKKKKHPTHKTQKNPQTCHCSNQKGKWKKLPTGILERPLEEVVSVSVGYISIYQLMRHVYTKADVWCEPQGKTAEIREEEISKDQFSLPCVLHTPHCQEL